jgi:hypothetical protein
MLLQEPLVETQCHSHQRQIPGRSLASALCLRVSEQPDASLDPALEQWEACLSIRTAFDPLHFIDESFNHAIAKGSNYTRWPQPPHHRPARRQKRSVPQSQWPGQRFSIALSVPAPRACASLRPKSCASVNTTAMVSSLWTSCCR